MAKNKGENLEATDNGENVNGENKTFKAIARQHIKYGGKHIKVDEEFEVKEDDVEELRKYAYIEEGE